MYHYPLLSSPDLGFIRAPGPGFGNLLFPITRALQEAKKLKIVDIPSKRKTHKGEIPHYWWSSNFY